MSRKYGDVGQKGGPWGMNGVTRQIANKTYPYKALSAWKSVTTRCICSTKLAWEVAHPSEASPSHLLLIRIL